MSALHKTHRGTMKKPFSTLGAPCRTVVLATDTFRADCHCKQRHFSQNQDKGLYWLLKSGYDVYNHEKIIIIITRIFKASLPSNEGI